MNPSFITDTAKWLCSFASTFTNRRTSPIEVVHTFCKCDDLELCYQI